MNDDPSGSKKKEKETTEEEETIDLSTPSENIETEAEILQPKSIPRTSVTSVEEDDEKVLEEIKKIADSIGKRDEGYFAPRSSQESKQRSSLGSDRLDPTRYTAEEMQKRIFRAKDKQSTSTSTGENLTSAGSEFLDPLRISLEGMLQKKIARAKEKQSSQGRRSGSVPSGLSDVYITRGSDKESSHSSHGSNKSSTSSGFLDPSIISFESLKNRFADLGGILSESDEQPSSSTLLLKKMGLVSGRTSPAGSLKFYAGGHSDSGGKKVPSKGAISKQTPLSRRLSSLSKHSDRSQKSESSKTSRSGKFEKRDPGAIQEQAFARFSSILESKRRSGTGLGHKFMHHHSTVGKTADKYKVSPGIKHSHSGHRESHSPHISPKDSASLKYSTTSSLSAFQDSDILSGLASIKERKATSRKSSVESASDSTSIIFPGGQFNLLARLADYLTEEKFINDEDHLMFIRTVKHMATVEIPEPILHGIKREVLPILKDTLKQYKLELGNSHALTIELENRVRSLRKQISNTFVKDT